MTKPSSGYVIRVGAIGNAPAHHRARVRFKRARPWIALPETMSDDTARAFATVLRRSARAGYGLDWTFDGAGVGRWVALLELADGTLQRVPIVERDHGEALARAESLARVVAAGGYRPKTPEDVETVRKYSVRWVTWREGERGIASAPEDRRRLDRHVLEVVMGDGVAFGDRPIASVGAEDIELVRDALDTKARVGFYVDEDGRRESFGWRTAIHVWTSLSVMFGDAVEAKARAMRVRTDNPTMAIAAPDRGAVKAKVYLWPSEFATLVACPDVPLRWKRLFALSIYLYVRPGELSALEWPDVDLEARVAHVHRSVDRVRKKLGVRPTKTKAARRMPIEPELVPLLAAMRKEAGGVGRVVVLPSSGVLSAKLRAYLWKAGVRRGDLHRGDATRKQVTYYDLRATGITWAAARGDDPLRISQRAGHEDFKTTQIYIREAENLSASFGEVFPPLPAELATAVEQPRRRARGQGGGQSRTRSEHDPLVDPRLAGWALQDLNL